MMEYDEKDNYWYPLYEEVLVQTIDDCDVDWRYAYLIVNDATSEIACVEDEDDAEIICDYLNSIIEDKP